MSSAHQVKQGEHLSNIAAQYGFRSYKTIWDDSGNAELRKTRKNPHVLLPGDVVQIPDKREKSFKRSTSKTHMFQVITRPLKFRLILRDFDNQPLPNLPCQLDVGGKTYALTSNGDGLIEQNIDSSAVEGKVTIPSLEFETPVRVGHLDPPEEDSGWAARLRNLGYYHKEISEDDAPRVNAIEEFQCDHDLSVTGILDDSTKAKLEQIHGC